MTLKLAIWDMDGTIVDSREIIQTAMVRAFDHCGLIAPTYDDTRKIVGLDLDLACRLLAPPDYDELARLVEAFKQAFVARRAEGDFKEPLYEGALETLHRLSAEGWLIAMATGKSHAGIRAIFQMHPLEPLFDTIWCADDGPGKPHPFTVEQAMKALGAEPDHTLMVGDAVHDMRMGRAAGVHCLGVSWGFGLADELEEAGAHAVHHDFGALDAALQDFSRLQVAR